MRKMTVWIMLVVWMLSMFSVGISEAQVQSAPLTTVSAAQNGMVRVLLSSMKYPTSLDITVSGSYTAEGDTKITLHDGAKISVSMNTSTGQMNLTVGGLSYTMGQELKLLRHQTSGQSGLKIAQAKMPGNLYPGDLQLKAVQNGSSYRMYPIVHVYLEYYLHGVVPYEMGNSAHLEALKAQAVAARTYTLNKMNVRASALYDVVDTTNDQVYYGNSDSTTRCTQAVDETRGIVLMNGNKLTETYYTASNGGQTESVANLWGSSGYDYLSVKDDPFDLINTASVKRKLTVYADNTNVNQNATLKSLLQSKLETVLRNYGYDTGNVAITDINSITPHTPKYTSPSRLYTKMDFEVSAVTNSGMVTATLTFDIFSELESALGMSINATQNELWSVEKNGNIYILYARRFGHGVGMSQRGAMQMGSLGYTYDQILGFYYEGCKRVQYTFTHTILSSLESGGSETIITTEEPADISASSGTTAIVKLIGISDKLAVRNAASSTGTILTSIVNGGLVNVLAQMDDWTMIQLGSIVGYVPTSALSFNGEVPQATDKTPTSISQWATVVCSGTLNLRTSASTSSGVITSMPSGSILCVFAQSGGWVQVQYGATTGWCSADFLQMSSVYPGQTSTDLSGAAAVTIPSGSGTVNLRETPSTAAKILATLSNGTQVTVTSSDGSWCSVVTADGTRGYIMAGYITYGESNAPSVSETPTPSPEPDADVADGIEAIVHTVSTSLNLRQEPSTQSAVLAAIPRGESIMVTNRGATWSAVRYGSLNGYVKTEYLRFPSDEETGDSVIAYATVTTVSGSLNIRKQPSLGSAVLMQIPRNARIGILQKLDGWCKVTYAGIDGYVMSSYISVEGQNDADSAEHQAIVTTPSGTLNLRSAPATTASVLTVIAPGTTVRVVSTGSEWCKIVYDQYQGYVMTKFLEFSADTSGSVSSGSTVRVHTGNGGLNLRETASASARVMLIIPDGAALTCLSYGSAWTRVQYGETTGYVMTKFLDVSGSSAAEDQVQGQQVTVATNGGWLNMRQSASTQATVLCSIPNGTTVTLLEQSGDWCHIRYGTTAGYVMTSFLSIGQQSTQQDTSSEQHAWIRSDVTGSVNLRFAPDTSAVVLTTLAPGTQVTVTLNGEVWSVVRYGETVGYVMSRYLTDTQPDHASSASQQPVYDETLYRLSGWEAVVVPNEGNVNLRAWCASDAPIRTAMPKGSVVRLIAYGDTWCQVVYGEVEGYCMTQYLALQLME